MKREQKNCDRTKYKTYPRYYTSSVCVKNVRNNVKLSCNLCSSETLRNNRKWQRLRCECQQRRRRRRRERDARAMELKGVERPRTTLRETPKAASQQPLGGIRSTIPTTRNYTAGAGLISTSLPRHASSHPHTQSEHCLWRVFYARAKSADFS